MSFMGTTGQSYIRALALTLFTAFLSSQLNASGLDRLEEIAASSESRTIEEFLGNAHFLEAYEQALIKYYGHSRFGCRTFRDIISELKFHLNRSPDLGRRLWKKERKAEKSLVLAKGGQAFMFRKPARKFHALWSYEPELSCEKDECTLRQNRDRDVFLGRWLIGLRGSSVHLVEQNGKYSGLAALLSPVRKGQKTFAWVASFGNLSKFNDEVTVIAKGGVTESQRLLDAWLTQVNKRRGKEFAGYVTASYDPAGRDQRLETPHLDAIPASSYLPYDRDAWAIADSLAARCLVSAGHRGRKPALTNKKTVKVWIPKEEESGPAGGVFVTNSNIGSNLTGENSEGDTGSANVPSIAGVTSPNQFFERRDGEKTFDSQSPLFSGERAAPNPAVSGEGSYAVVPPIYSGHNAPVIFGGKRAASSTPTTESVLAGLRSDAINQDNGFATAIESILDPQKPSKKSSKPEARDREREDRKIASVPSRERNASVAEKTSPIKSFEDPIRIVSNAPLNPSPSSSNGGSSAVSPGNGASPEVPVRDPAGNQGGSGSAGGSGSSNNGGSGSGSANNGGGTQNPPDPQEPAPTREQVYREIREAVDQRKPVSAEQMTKLAKLTVESEDPGSKEEGAWKYRATNLLTRAIFQNEDNSAAAEFFASDPKDRTLTSFKSDVQAHTYRVGTKCSEHERQEILDGDDNESE